VVPDSLNELLRHFEHFHLALFFMWRRFYELAKRLAGVHYKSVSMSNGAAQGVDYVKPGRIIMLQMLISLAVLSYRLIRAALRARRRHRRLV